MSAFSAFMKRNKTARENVRYAVTKSLCDENGNPLEWEIRPLSTKENDKIREAYTREIPIKGKPGLTRTKFDGKGYIAKMLTASVVAPDLNDAELQDSYGVMSAEDLLKEMVDNPGEYSEFAEFVQKFNGFEITLDEEVEEVKNE